MLRASGSGGAAFLVRFLRRDVIRLLGRMQCTDVRSGAARSAKSAQHCPLSFEDINADDEAQKTKWKAASTYRSRRTHSFLCLHGTRFCPTLSEIYDRNAEE